MAELNIIADEKVGARIRFPSLGLQHTNPFTSNRLQRTLPATSNSAPATTTPPSAPGPDKTPPDKPGHTYVGADPINESDPSGEDIFEDVSTALSGVGDVLDASGLPEVGGVFDAAGAAVSTGSAIGQCIEGSNNCGSVLVNAGVDDLTAGTAAGLGSGVAASAVSGVGLGYDLSPL